MPSREKLTFPGATGDQLAGLLELPEGEPRATALFAHCFTCGKDVSAASRIARALVSRGFAVLRFDFTGLGGSEGEFANTNFSSNVQDLVAAAAFLRGQARPVSVLIGHSLGGTAVLQAARELPECRAVITLGAPADASHVAKQFGCELDTIERDGEARVSLAGRPFTIRRQFLEDIRDTSIDHLSHLEAALLVMHSPLDSVVSIDQAERIYRAAKHPKSFVSLDDADHLLTRARDADYVASLIAPWAARFLDQPATEARPKVGAGELVVQEHDHAFLLDLFSDTHHWLADEPRRVGGSDGGPDPYEHLLASVGSCTAMTLRLYAARKRWPLEDARITLRHSREHRSDCEDCDEKPLQLEVIERDIALIGPLDDTQRARLMEIADRCPVHRTLSGQLEIRTSTSRSR